MLVFETKKGNMYAWDNEVGLFIPFSPTMRAVINEISIKDSSSREGIIDKLKENFDAEEISFCYDWIKKWKKIRFQNYRFQTQESSHISNIKRHVLKNGLSQITLCVTEDCNFRCKYCAYSDYYEYTRDYSNRYMDFAIAKKAIDYYLTLLKEGKKYNPFRRPAIGFYGGEPLLNFRLIKECVEYIKNMYRDYKIQFTLTTNGSLLDKEKANWLMKHEFSISISLDGPEEEHNRLRVYCNGKGTFRDVIRNIGYIVDAGYKEIYSLPVFDWKSNLFKQEEFFNRRDVPPALNVSIVDDSSGSRYYNQFTREDRSEFSEKLEKARSYYFENIACQGQKERASFFDNLINRTIENELLGGISIYPPAPIMPFTGACVPGRKIFVDVNGDYHACERINNSFPVGNVNEGLNFEKIHKMIDYYISRMDKCPDCTVSRKCGCCYKQFATNKEFSCSSTVCNGIESDMKGSFINTFEIAEINPEFVEKNNFKHRNIKKYYGD